jgi:hypothetical protein
MLRFSSPIGPAQGALSRSRHHPVIADLIAAHRDAYARAPP